MKKLLGIVVLGLFLITPSQANDIEDFEIEGMSIGDSLLDYFSKSEIENNSLDKKENPKFHRIIILDKKSSLASQYKAIKTDLKIYNGMHIYIDPTDKNYSIYGIEGMLDFPNNYKGCLAKKKEIENSISELFKNSESKRKTSSHPTDKTGKSIVNEVHFKIDPKNEWYEFRLQCFDWSENKKFIDHFRITILTDEVNDMIEEIYNRI